MLYTTVSTIFLDPLDGFEPPLTESESVVLPLDERGMKSIHINTLRGQSKSHSPGAKFYRHAFVRID